jgi:hypothetical protein
VYNQDAIWFYSYGQIACERLVFFFQAKSAGLYSGAFAILGLIKY